MISPENYCLWMWDSPHRGRYLPECADAPYEIPDDENMPETCPYCGGEVVRTIADIALEQNANFDWWGQKAVPKDWPEPILSAAHDAKYQEAVRRGLAAPLVRRGLKRASGYLDAMEDTPPATVTRTAVEAQMRELNKQISQRYRAVEDNLRIMNSAQIMVNDNDKS